MIRRVASAFTLIEMLVVISIIALLISILQPSLAKARRNADTVKCASQIAQMARAVVSYADDNRGRTFPMIHLPGKYWIGMLSPYWQRDDRIMLCPAASTTSGGLGDAQRAWGPIGGWGDGKAGSYGMNLWLLPTGDFATDVNMPQAGYIRTMDYASSDTPVFGDSQWVGAWPNDQDILPTNFQTPPNTHALGYFMSRFCVDRHDMSINVSFVDGSARRVEIRGLWRLKWHKTFKPGDPVVP